MKLKIERTIGETRESYDMDGTYEEVLALVTELGFCKEVVYYPNVIINTNSQKSSLDILKEYYTKWILNENRPGGLFAK